MSGTQAPTEMELVGSANSYWGVCGFTSTLQAVYELHPGRKGLVIGVQIPTLVLADIKIYLTLLKGLGNFKLLKEIETFTRTFPKVKDCDFRSFKIDNYTRRLMNDPFTVAVHLPTGSPPRAKAHRHQNGMLA